MNTGASIMHIPSIDKKRKILSEKRMNPYDEICYTIYEKYVLGESDNENLLH